MCIQPESDSASIRLAHSVMGFGVPLHPAAASYYSNVTGFVHGLVEMRNLTAMNLSAPAGADANGGTLGAEAPLSASRDLEAEGPPAWAPLASEFTKDINMTSALERLGTWNWSAPTEMAFRVIERRPVLRVPGASSAWGEIPASTVEDVDVVRMNASLWEDVSLMHGRVELADKTTGEEMGFDMEAVHFVENGTVYGLAEPSGCVAGFFRVVVGMCEL